MSLTSLSNQQKWQGECRTPVKLLKICMVFTRWFIHEWLGNLLWIFCFYVTAVDRKNVNWTWKCELKGHQAKTSQVSFLSSVVSSTHNNQRCVHTHISLLLLDFDPNLGMMAGITPLNPLMPGLGLVPAPVSQEVPLVKEIIHCKSCTLFPPNPSKSYNLAHPARYTSKTSSNISTLKSCNTVNSIFWQ